MALFDGSLLATARNRFSAVAKGEFISPTGVVFRDARAKFATEFDTRFASAVGRWGAFEPLPAATGLPPGSTTGLPDQLAAGGAAPIVFRDMVGRGGVALIGAGVRPEIAPAWSGPDVAPVGMSERFSSKAPTMVAERSGAFAAYPDSKRALASERISHSSESPMLSTGWKRGEALSEAHALGLEIH